MKTRKFILGITSSLLVGIYSCAVPPVQPTPSSSVSPSASVSVASPTPSASATVAPVTYTYDLPFKVTNNSECEANSTPKNIYEIKIDGTYTFVSDQDTTKNQSRQLTVEEIKSFKQYMVDLNIAKLAESDQNVEAGAPQSTECRIIENFDMNVNGQEKMFDRNGRKLIHTKEYFDALERLRTKLNQLKSQTNFPKYSYTFPLKITNVNECSAESSERVLYQVDQDGTFTFITNENDLSKTSSRKLNNFEIDEINTVLSNTDIAAQAEKDTIVPEGTPQTKECRTIENYKIGASGTERVFDRNGRKLSHTQQYIDSLMAIKNKLIDLSKK